MFKWTFSLGALLAGSALVLGSALSAGVPVSPSDFVSSRTSGAGVTATSPWSNPGGFTLGWNITQTGSTFHYLYTLTIPQKNPSHILLQLSNTITDQNFNQIITNFELNGSPYTPVGPELFVPGGMGNSNPGLPGNLYGMKIDFSGGVLNTFSFDSTRAPMWGDFYSKDGKSGGHDVIAYNTGFGQNPTPNFQNWIAVPDTHEINVPEPTTYALLAACLAIGMLVSRRRATALS